MQARVIPAVQSGLQLVVHLRERGGPTLQRTILDKSQPREQRCGIPLVRTGVGATSCGLCG